MYIVVRTFRDAFGVFSAGSVVEPAEVRTFKSRLTDGHILDIDEHNKDRWAEFFKNRCNVNLDELLSENESSVDTTEEETTIDTVAETETAIQQDNSLDTSW